MIGSAVFVGMTISALITSQLANKYGRKPVVTGSYLGLFIFSTLLLLSSDIYFTTALMLSLGFCIIGIISVSYVYTCEMLSPDQLYIFNKIWVIMDGVANSTAILCYMFVANNILVVSSAQFSLVILALVTLVNVPESPLWLIKSGKE
jgi:MFS family permease